MILGIVETYEINLSDGNRLEKLRILFTEGYIKSLGLLQDYIRRVLKNRETALKNNKKQHPPPFLKLMFITMSMWYIHDTMIYFYIYFYIYYFYYYIYYFKFVLSIFNDFNLFVLF